MLSSNIVKILPLAAALLAVSAVAFGAEDHVVLNTMSEEIQRNFQALKLKADPPPYFLSYEITDDDIHSVSASLGVLNEAGNSHNRYLDVTVRVGDPKLDNFRRVRGDRIEFTSGASVVLDDDPAALKQRIWLETDRVYRAAAERLIKIKTNQQVKAADRDQSADFSSEESYAHWEQPAVVTFDSPRWTKSVRELSKDFLEYPDLLSSDVQVSVQADNRYFANTEGTKVQHGRDFARVIITASARAKDGMDVSDFESFEAANPKDLPANDVIKAAVKKVGGNVEALLSAKTAEPFVGPAILSGRASGVFFHEIFGHRIEGHRQKDESEGQTFTKSVGEKILPDFLTVTFDPTLKRMAGVDLNGYYGGPARLPLTAITPEAKKEIELAFDGLKG